VESVVRSSGEAALYERIRELVVNARRTVARGIGLVQVHANFEIGRHVVAHEQQGKTRAKYGREVLKRLIGVLRNAVTVSCSVHEAPDVSR
jgi:ABC-type amino acid transport system permease subunit